jgi:TnpA family transposase
MLDRVVRAASIMRYLHDAKLRDRIQLQLNRGEGRHALTKRLFFGNDGVFRTGEADELMNKVSALSVLSNAVLIWNLDLEHNAYGRDRRGAGEELGTDDSVARPRSHIATP